MSDTDGSLGSDPTFDEDEERANALEAGEGEPDADD
jgi:hypothetical protein